MAGANGSEVYFAGGSVGSFAPRRETVIRLVREELALRVVEPGQYAAHARYLLANPGPEKRVTYGVPVLVHRMVESPADGIAQSEARGNQAAARRWEVYWREEWARRMARAREVASTIRVTLAGKTHRCELENKPPPPAPIDPADPANGSDPVRAPFAWCTVSLSIPRGDGVVLELEYAAPLVTGGDDEREVLYEASDGKIARRGYTDRLLIYPLSPAATWAGRPTHLRIKLDRGPYPLPLQPGGFVSQGPWLVWDFDDPDFAALGSFVLRFYPKPEVDHARRRFRERHGVALTATGSSSIEPSSVATYVPENAVDGRPETAWCVNTPTGGVGEWIEIRPVSTDAKPPRAVAIRPGYGKSDATWVGNGRVTKVRLEACGSGRPLFDGDVALEPTNELQEIGGEELGELGCLRIEIRATQPGRTSKDTCISDIDALDQREP
jgi:hypothetical protein